MSLEDEKDGVAKSGEKVKFSRERFELQDNINLCECDHANDLYYNDYKSYDNYDQGYDNT